MTTSSSSQPNEQNHMMWLRQERKKRRNKKLGQMISGTTDKIWVHIEWIQKIYNPLLRCK